MKSSPVVPNCRQYRQRWRFPSDRPAGAPSAGIEYFIKGSTRYLPMSNSVDEQDGDRIDNKAIGMFERSPVHHPVFAWVVPVSC
jgi:hypothetical protein